MFNVTQDSLWLVGSGLVYLWPWIVLNNVVFMYIAEVTTDAPVSNAVCVSMWNESLRIQKPLSQHTRENTTMTCH